MYVGTPIFESMQSWTNNTVLAQRVSFGLVAPRLFVPEHLARQIRLKGFDKYRLSFSSSFLKVTRGWARH